jgi:hypothetical protein
MLEVTWTVLFGIAGGIFAPYPASITVGVKMDRNFKAPLSTSLRGLRMNEKRQIPASHRQLLLSMGLVVVARDDLILTETGSQRLEHEEWA